MIKYKTGTAVTTIKDPNDVSGIVWALGEFFFLCIFDTD